VLAAQSAVLPRAAHGGIARMIRKPNRATSASNAALPFL
jgi:hypothetical protein